MFLGCGLCVICLFRSRRPFFIWGSFEKSVMSTMLSSISVSKSSSILVCFGYGELDLGSVSKFLTTLASHDVASCSISLFSSSKLRFLKEGGVTNSIGGIFPLLELSHSGSPKYLGLYSCSVGLGHGPESDVMLLLFFLGVKTPGEFLGNLFPIFSLFLPQADFSVCFSVSSTNNGFLFCLDF